MSNNLDLQQSTSNADLPEVEVNDATGQLDAALTLKVSFAIDNTNARTLTNDEFRRNALMHIVDDAPAPTGAITLTVPAVSRGPFYIHNETAQTVTVTIAAQAVTAPTVVTALTTYTLLVCDGVNVRSTI